jgi:tRNA(Ile)-lysidine synthase
LLTCATSADPLSLPEFAASLAALARFEDAPFVAVGVSGGPDSLALVILVDRWARERNGEICALTVDHRLRPESRAEIGRLATWLSARGIRHEVLVWTGRKPKSGIQEAARIARYRLLAEWCREHGCPHLLTAHHREDQIETHLIRRRAQSGADGLAGMSAIRELDGCRLLRPLLSVARDRLVAFLAAEHQPFIADPSNLDPAFERSRYRRDGGNMPLFADSVRLFDEIRDFGRARQARQRDWSALLGRGVSLHPAGFAWLDPAFLSGTPPELAERALSALTVAVGGAAYPPRRERIARLRDRLSADGAPGYTLGHCRFVGWRGCVLVFRERARAAPPISLAPGNALLWDRRFEIVVPPTASGSLTLGYAADAGAARLKPVMPLLGRTKLPRILFPILPVLWDENGIAAVPHLGYRRDGLGAVPQLTFRPINPLTQASFAVV